MRSSVLPALPFMLAATYEEDRHRYEERRHAQRRALLEGRPPGASLPTRLGAAIAKVVQRDQSLTAYACRLPDGKIGRIAVVLQNGDWVLVCRVA